MDLNSTTQTSTVITTGVDIDALLASDVAQVAKIFTVTVIHDDDGNHKAGFDIVGKNSEQYQKVIRVTSMAAIKRSQTKKQQIDGKTDAGAGQLYDLGEDRQLKIATAVVVGLPGFTAAGQPLAVTEANITALLKKFPDWVTKINAALEVDANFLTI